MPEARGPEDAIGWTWRGDGECVCEWVAVVVNRRGMGTRGNGDGGTGV